MRPTPTFIRALLIGVALGATAARAGAVTTEVLLDTLEQKAFDYFWNEANPANGLIKDRSTGTSPCSIAAVGFGLSAICTGIDRGYVSRDAGRARVLTTLNTFWTGPQGTAANGTIGYKGFFYHFLTMDTAQRAWGSELSSIDTALLFAGILDTREYFTTPDPLDVQVRALADSLYLRADWEWFRASGPGIRMGWKPESGFNNFGTWTGYNEAMMIYILALGSPTHAPNWPSMWSTWTSTYHWETHYGQTYLVFAPLFGHQYSHCWIDFRNTQDAFMRSKGITYFENSRRATLAQQAYCIANPSGFTGYGANGWGITASDDPEGYSARGAPPPQDDDGTLVPSAVGGSVPFAPEIALPTLDVFFANYPLLWSTYGFKDAFNLGQNWWDTDYLGIDQGPIILMIENYRTQAIWNRFMGDPYILAGLASAGFHSPTGVAQAPAPRAGELVLNQNAPNPFRKSALVTYRLGETGPVSLVLYDVLGRPVRSLVQGVQTAGEHQAVLDGQGLASGVYYYKLDANGQQEGRRCVVVR
jgi:hypothetical protein